MKLEFKPEDFDWAGYGILDGKSIRAAANMANAKLEKYIKEQGTVVYGQLGLNEYKIFTTDDGAQPTHTAILINIDEIKKCEHPKEKVQILWSDKTGSDYFKCECGAKVEPVEFRAVE